MSDNRRYSSGGWGPLPDDAPDPQADSAETTHLPRVRTSTPRSGDLPPSQVTPDMEPPNPASLPAALVNAQEASPPAPSPASAPPAKQMGTATRPLKRPAGVARTKAGKPHPKRQHRWKRISLIAALVILVLGGVLSIGGYFGLYGPARQLAADGAKHLQNAQNLIKQLVYHPLQEKTLAQTRDEFSAAENDFQGVNIRLTLAGPFLGLIGFFSGRGDEINSYVHLAHMTLDLSKAGTEALDVGITLLHKEQNALQDPGSAKLAALVAPGIQPVETDSTQVASGLSMSDITAMQQTANDVVALVEDAWQEVQGVTLSALPAGSSIQPAVTLFRNDYPGLHDLLLSLQGAMTVAPRLFGVGQTTTYLAELLDTSERRGAGGFIAAVGPLSAKNGQLADFSLQDTYLLDTPYQASHTTPVPSADSWFSPASNWGLRDANLEPDFPTAAKAAEHLYTAEGGSQVDGVIALSTSFFTHVLTITGQVQIPELNEVIDETNLVDRLHFYQFARSDSDAVASTDLSSANGQFSALFSKHLLEKLRQLTPAATVAVLQETVLALNDKDMQFYINDARGEQALLKGHKAGAVEAPSGDALFVVDTNISGNKADDNIDETQQDNIALDDQGNAIHHLVVTYNWNRSAPVYGSNIYTDYVRVYVPPDSQLQGYSNLSDFSASKAYGRTLWAGSMQVSAGQGTQFTLTYLVPHAVHHQQSQLHYVLLAQRQVSNPLSRLVLTISLPQGSTLAQHSGNLYLSPSSADNLLLNQLLDRDTTMTVDYS